MTSKNVHKLDRTIEFCRIRMLDAEFSVNNEVFLKFGVNFLRQKGPGYLFNITGVVRTGFIVISNMDLDCFIFPIQNNKIIATRYIGFAT